MDFKQLQSFVAIVKYKSFTKAAEDLFLSQPTISAHIKQLEEELHTKLIMRTTKSIEITEKGKKLFDYAVNIMDLKERMMQVCQENEQCMIHIGASTIPSAYILPEILPQYGSRNANIYFVIHQNDSKGVLDGILGHVFDIGLIGMKTDHPDVVCKPFCKDKMVLITPINEHFLKMKKQNELEIRTLLQEPIILREQGSGSQKNATHFLETLGMEEKELHVVARINDQEAIKNLVAGGLGISIISYKAAKNFLDEKRILSFELPDDSNQRFLYLVYRKNRMLRKEVKEFANYVEKFYDLT